MSNSLSAMRPELVREWSDKNPPLTPDMINEKSRKMYGGNVRLAATSGSRLFMSE